MPLAGFSLNPACQLTCSVLSSSIALLLKRNPCSQQPLPQMFFLLKKNVLRSFTWSMKPPKPSPLSSSSLHLPGYYCSFLCSSSLLHPLSTHLYTSSPFFFSSSFSSSSLPGWNVAVWASVNCGLSAVVASSPKAQSQQGWNAGWSRRAK